MKTNEQLKQLVKDKYTEIALQSKEQNESSCCGSGCCSTEVYSIMSDDYTQLEGYNADADLGLGCGLPTEFAQIKTGDTVIDLGSGAGNDCFIARSIVGETGKIIGIDFTEAMIIKARENAAKLNYSNVQFRMGEIEHLPVPDNYADVIVSNCVLNLVPDKAAAFSEIFRVLKPGAHFSVSDIVLEGELHDSLKEAAEMYAGCISGAIQKDTYINLIKEKKFTDVIIQKEKVISIPKDILSQYLSPQEVEAYNQSHAGIYSITVFGVKPLTGSCCGPACCN